MAASASNARRPARRDVLVLAATGLCAFIGRQARARPTSGAAPLTAPAPRSNDTVTAQRSPSAPEPAEADQLAASEGRLGARPIDDVARRPSRPGVHALGLSSRRYTLLYVPRGHDAAVPSPLVVLLHGAGGDADSGLSLLSGLADRAGLLLLAPAARRATWDVIRGSYGPDVTLLDEALTHVFERHAIDRSCLAIGGFSDGASYALSLGLTNGDLFTHVVAFSPGFLAPSRLHGSPRIFLTHGTEDAVLPIDACSRRMLPRLRASGYEVDYREFQGPHTVPRALRRGAVAWLRAGDDAGPA